ncbi:serine hydrolase domain-containing protein [Virgibacillus kekensis]|uniref:Serine hydrolase domain-containing protein n=1 Tax=Virgibacillus kekensis TaxID=202261 RepID=A0ABV9DN23_9BACI
MRKELEEIVSEVQREVNFSGTILVKKENDILMDKSFGYANCSDKLENNSETRFGIASGCKLFTAIAICQLIQNGKLSFEDRIKDVLDYEFAHFDDSVTVHHLLTHTSGIPDYFDEDEMDDFEELWVKHPMYALRELKDFLPLFQQEKMKCTPGEKFHYNNAGFIVLGLILQQVSNMKFQDYIEEFVFKKAGMNWSGYFAFDLLPSNVAQGYIDNKDGTWRTNIYSLPVIGGSDGGAYVTAGDMARLWEALVNEELLDKKYTELLLKKHVSVNEDSYYGYGVWIREGSLPKYHVMGYDPGVSFHSGYYQESSITMVVCSNKSDGAFEIMRAIEEEIK